VTGGPSDGWAVLERAHELAQRGENFALATVVWRQAPSSGHQGSRAIVTAGGEMVGWIGGACAEPVVLREAQQAILDGTARLLLLGTPDQFGHVPDGMTVIPISCQSEGALEVYIEPVLSAPRVVVVGASPMAHTLADLVRVLGWRAELVDGSEFTSSNVEPGSVVVIATQGHGDEDAVEHAIAASPAFVGLVASRKRKESVLGYLADRGVPRDQLDHVHAPVGLDLGHTSHTEIAVAILAELVQLRAAGALGPNPVPAGVATSAPTTAIDPVCGMTVDVGSQNRPFEYDGETYYFCSAGCRTAFERDPAAYVRLEEDNEARC
jgi:xanthine dehydrogenase accessory factor